ncbi:hypothetical protein [Stenotrophomonas sp. SG1]|uniref:hypothetical protein n=1 Tax=Stenotrophomonas sp. SG1 TaxID=2944932 RepID=UPI002243375C|nr:hypothetical protein [Stenotrophomonas sp. SG1]MCW8340553.1 hypothetical protein [Stenotrophomonas sp. SG1]
MNEKTFTLKDADELEKKIEKDRVAFEEKQAADLKRVQDARRAAAGETFEDALNTLSKISAYLTEAQKAQVSKLFAPAKKGGKSGNRKPRNSTPKEPREHNRFLHDGKKTPFAYAGKGRKPDILREFEASDVGAKLIEQGKPTYGDL